MFSTQLSKNIHNWLSRLAPWAEAHLLVWATVAQIALALAAFLFVRLILGRVALSFENRARNIPNLALSQLGLLISRFMPWLVLLMLLQLGSLAFHQAGERDDVLRLVFSLVLAWVIIRLSSGLVRDPTLSRAIAITGWIIAALNIAGLIGPTATVLDSLAITIGKLRLSVFLLIKGAIALFVLLWLANFIARLIEMRVRGMPLMAPAMQVLITKLTRISLLTLAVVLALGSVGIDLTAFAVFSGAIGVGIGFGLQKVVSNLISGVILLLDRSIKPGDVIQIDNTYGWITQLNARYVSVSTRDGLEYLIPNEDLITQRVVNWSYTSDAVRLHVDFGISYSADVHHAMALAVEAAAVVGRVLEEPAPICLLTEFADSSVNLQLRFWINDPRNGTANVRSQVMLEIWDRFKSASIEFPFPQRDLNIRDPGLVAEAFSKVLHQTGNSEGNLPSQRMEPPAAFSTASQ